MNKEKEIKEFYNKRIKLMGKENFKPKIAKDNFAAKSILNILKKEIDLKDKKILDAGCGEGRFSKYFIEKNANITSLDISEEYINVIKANIRRGKFVVGSVTDLPFPKNSFDYIFSVDVLQHVPNINKAIKEFHRVLKINGKVIIIDKNKFGLNSKYLIPQILIQKYKELTEWRYEGFKERWFSPNKFERVIKLYFKETEYEYIIEKNKIFKIFPKINLFVVYTARK